MEHVAARLANRVGGLPPAGDFDAVGFRHAEFGEPFLGGQDQGGVAVGNLGAIVGLEREPVHDIAVEPSMVVAWSRVICTLLICAQGLNLALAYSWTAMAARSRSVTPHTGHVVAHHFGEDMREDEDLAFALVGVGEVAEHFADELAVHFAFGIAHFFVAHGDAGVAHAELQLLNDAEDGLTAGGAGVLHGLDGLAFQAGSAGHQSGKEPLFIEREVAGGADAADVQGGGVGGDFAAGALTAASRIRGTVRPISFPNCDWWNAAI